MAAPAPAALVVAGLVGHPAMGTGEPPTLGQLLAYLRAVAAGADMALVDGMALGPVTDLGGDATRAGYRVTFELDTDWLPSDSRLRL